MPSIHENDDGRNDMRRALQVTAGALAMLVAHRRARESEEIKFTGVFAHLGTLSIGEILDSANTALEGAPSQMGVKWNVVVENEPPQKTLVMVTGDSGHLTFPQFLTLAYIDDEYRPRTAHDAPRWLSVNGDGLFVEYGWHPTHWAYPVALPGAD